MINPEKLLLIILDGVPYRNFRRLFGNLEGWVASGVHFFGLLCFDSYRPAATCSRCLWQ